ncbi:MAG: nucleotidyltransferase domain-containing protein [Chloroflexi bacterium]|nr:MAG: nucleotidyltransferase domain-containing protein [Chloroflexota bacterium]
MRLTRHEVEVIKATILALDAGAKIYLFGSRADDSKRGGDIDLLILSSKLSHRDKRAIRLALHEQLGEQRIDILIARDTSRPLVRIALAEGVEL